MSTSCGLYRTTKAIGEAVPAGALVYYHDHGDPGPGVYLPRDWNNNRALFHEHGTTVPDDSYAKTLEPLLTEGFYRVTESFYCCADKCRRFDPELMVQIGYNGDAQAILFVPEVIDGAIALPAEGTFVDDGELCKLKQLIIPESHDHQDEPAKDKLLQ